MEASWSQAQPQTISQISVTSRVAKYATNGNVQWIRRLDGDWCEINDRGVRACQANDEANALALGTDGSVFAAGSMQDDGTSSILGSNEHFHVIKFSSDGNTLWSKAAEDPAFEAEYVSGHAFALSVNAFGNVVAAGVHNGHFTLVKFWGRTGLNLTFPFLSLLGAKGFFSTMAGRRGPTFSLDLLSF